MTGTHGAEAEAVSPPDGHSARPGAIIERRVCAELDGEFVLFLIGIRINRPWKALRWWPVFSAMPRMLRELGQRPDLGLLHARTHFGLRGAMMVQYWRSFDALEAYAHAKDRAHLPAWQAFQRAVGTNGDVGIWHETYVIKAGAYENVFVNMPPFGLGAAGVLRDATAARREARGRMNAAQAGNDPS
jgi:hypothetical protein